MGQPNLNRDVQDFLGRHFLRHYRRIQLEVRDPERREWMRQELDGTTRRPLFFTSNEAAREACRRPPHGLFASAATYDLKGVVSYEDLPKAREADAPLDIDCKTGAPPKGDGFQDLTDAFLAARRHTQMTLETLRRDFAVEDKEVDLRFSGGKGYHILLISDRFRRLTRDSRTELLATLTGANTQPALMFPGIGGPRLPPTPPTGGAARHIWESLNALQAASRRPITSPRLRQILEHHATMRGLPDLLIALRQANISDLLQEHPDWWPALTACAHHFTGPLVDGAVLMDLRRQVRVPGSINGKTGLLCMRLKPDALADFEPFTHANPHDRTGTVPVRGRASASVTVADETFTICPNEWLELPLRVAVPWVAQGLAAPDLPASPASAAL